MIAAARFVVAVVLACVLPISSAALAADAETDARFKAMEATIAALQAEIADMRKQDAELRKKVEVPPSPVVSRGRGEADFKLRGQIAADVAAFDNHGPADFNSGTQIRRARFGFEGRVEKDWLYRLEMDVAGAGSDDSANGEIDIKDAFISYRGFDKTYITLGQHTTPNTLEEALASTDILFTESPLYSNAFTDRKTAGGGYKMGLSVKYMETDWMVMAGVYGENAAINGGGNSGGTPTPVYKDEGWGPAARVTYAPVNDKDKTLHFGLSGYWRDTGGRTSGVRFRAGPEVSVDNTKLVDTGNINTNSYSFVGGEFAGQWGPVYWQSEFGGTMVDQFSGPSLAFQGGYFSASYVFTGENRVYAEGNFARIRPQAPFSLSKGTWGAWELASRISYIDLNDDTILGGEETNYSLGINWYPSSYTRFLFDYVHFDAEQAGVTNDGDALIGRFIVIW